ncbi:MAG: GguC family protein [Chloroflexi bacterium]|nr:GguC family protein [Chloroflexota bacterium]
MRVVQFVLPGEGSRVGVIDGESVADITSVAASLRSVYDAAQAGFESGRSFEQVLFSNVGNVGSAARLDYADLLAAPVGGNKPYLISPVAHADPHRVLVSGTGLTHTGSMKSRDQMHSKDASESAEPQSDSAKMFQMGLDGGKPDPGRRGTSPEWFYKGNGAAIKGPGGTLELPAFALDGGEEPELAACYLIAPDGAPRRLGFALGNEWSDHETERINYLYLAPSKLRECAVGPELVTGFDFKELELTCTVRRGGETIYDSGTLYTGENYMSHTLANCEDHHFKYPQHRVPGDAHVHFFGTSQLSFSTRDWKYAAGDEIEIASPEFSAPLRNVVAAGAADAGMVIPVQDA